MFNRKSRFNFDEAFHIIHSLFRPETGWEILKTIADTHAPSQTVHYTRAIAVQRLLEKLGNGSYSFDINYGKTGNALLSIGGRSPRILFFAHADEISYLVGDQQNDSW